ncbi:DoxX family membrane protein [Patescibacteria group bacterium]|nr:DoxX family membrane protein [Patescibacteria group bacterium]
MLNTFPQFLSYGFYAPALLRCAVALVMLYLAYCHFKNKDAINQEKFPVIGARAWVAWFSVILEVAVGLALLFGYHTQIAAILTALVGIKHAFWTGKYPSYFVLSRTAALLVLAIALSLLASGAGALAMDLPL